MLKKTLNNGKKININKRAVLTTALVLFQFGMASASQNAGAFQGAFNEIKGYLNTIDPLLKIIGALVGVIGGLRIYNKWSNGDQDINKELVGWGGAAIFLILSGTFIKTIFNVI